MVNVSEIQAKLLDKVFNVTDLSQSIEIQTYVTSTNAFNEPVEVFSTQAIVRGMVLDYTKFKRKYDTQGLNAGSSFILLLPHDTTITESDRVVFNSTTYSVINTDTIPFGTGFTHLIVFLQKDN